VGVYNHVPGDGRELVVTDADAVKIRAEDGRCVEAVDISPFISNLPFGKVRAQCLRCKDGLFVPCAARAKLYRFASRGLAP
jgi:predicted ABC-class ATPase